MRKLPRGGDLGGILEFSRRHFPRDRDSAAVYVFLARRLKRWSYRMLVVELGLADFTMRTLLARGERLVKGAAARGEFDQAAQRELIRLISPQPPREKR